jgi:hypothetical protein
MHLLRRGPGTYTVTLNRVGYVDGQFDPLATITQTVKAGAAVQPLSLYDQSGSRLVPWPATSASTSPAPSYSSRQPWAAP